MGALVAPTEGPGGSACLAKEHENKGPEKYPKRKINDEPKRDNFYPPQKTPKDIKARRWDVFLLLFSHPLPLPGNPQLQGSEVPCLVWDKRPIKPKKKKKF